MASLKGKKNLLFLKLQKKKNFWKVGCDLWNCSKPFKVEAAFTSGLILCFWEGEGERRKKGERKKIELKKEGAWTIAVFLHRVSTFCLSTATQVWSRCRLNFRGLLSLLAPIDRWVNGNWLDALLREDKKNLTMTNQGSSC